MSELQPSGLAVPWQRRLGRRLYALARVALPGGRWRLRSRGRCPSCGENTLFVLATRHARWVEGLVARWDNSDVFKRGLVERESELCGLCRANFRLRMQAAVALELLAVPDVNGLFDRLRSENPPAIYETARWNVFRHPGVGHHSRYVSSEYFDGAKPGDVVGGVLHQDLQQLSFADDSFDLVLTSEVLEHVADLDRALTEIRRVLRPGGHHVCTVPSDPVLAQTIERARLVNGEIVHLETPVMHGDSIRDEGILAFRDFGKDAAARLSIFGLPCAERKFSNERGFVTSVFVAQKSSYPSDNGITA